MMALFKRFGPWVLAAVLLVGAWFVQLYTPDQYANEQPFTKTVTVGEQGFGRNIAVTVTDVVIADRVTDDTGVSLAGTWVVVNFNAQAVKSARQASLRSATLVASGREYSASERVSSFIDTALVPGVPKAGAVAFELAPDALGGTLAISFALNPIRMLDSVIEVKVQTDDLQRVAEATLAPAHWATGE